MAANAAPAIHILTRVAGFGPAPNRASAIIWWVLYAHAGAASSMSTDLNFFDGEADWHGGSGEGRLSSAIMPDLPGWLRELYPFAVRTFFLADERMSFIDAGDPAAPPLLLLHDSPGWSFAFRRLIPPLSAHYRVLAPDLVGFGLSSKPGRPGQLSLSAHATAVAEFLQAMEVKELSMLLHGWGGPIGMAYAVRAPDTVRHVLLANSWAMPLPHATNIRFPFWLRLALSGGLGSKLDSVLKMSITTGVESAVSPLPGLVVEGYKYPYQHGEPSHEVRSFWERLRRPDEPTVKFLADVAAGLPRIGAVCEIVWGRQDRLLRNLTAYLLRDRLRAAADITFLEEAGHNVVEDAPEALLAKLLGGPVVVPEGPRQ